MHRRVFLTGTIGLVSAPRALLAGQEVMRMRDLYNKDLSFSDFALKSESQRVAVKGFMAPPLKAESNFFVLTKRPMAVCPFCETEAEWPDDIVMVYTKRTVEVMPFNRKIITRGELALGSYKDPETGFVSRVRLMDGVYERA